MTIDQTALIVATEPFMAIGALLFAVSFFAVGGWIESKFGWAWCHAMVTAPFVTFWLVCCWPWASGEHPGVAFAAMVPFAILWIVRLRTTARLERA